MNVYEIGESVKFASCTNYDNLCEECEECIADAYKLVDPLIRDGCIIQKKQIIKIKRPSELWEHKNPEPLIPLDF